MSGKSKTDQGWAWIVCGATTLHVFLLVGLAKSFGIFFVEFLSFYSTNSSVLSAVLAVQTLLLSFSSLFVLNVGTKILGNRKLIIIGGVMSSASYLFTALIPDIRCMALSLSVLYGFGCACTTGPSYVVLNTYFDKRLGFANSLTYVGGSLGSLIMPTLIYKLVQCYGLQGALLIVAGLLLNNVVVGSLMRPFPHVIQIEETKTLLETTKSITDKEKPLKEQGLFRKESIQRDYCVSEDNLLRSLKQNHMAKNLYSNCSINSNMLKRSVSERFGVNQNHFEAKDKANGLFESILDVYGTLRTSETFNSMEGLRSKPDPNQEEMELASSGNNSILSFLKHIINIEVLRSHLLQLVLFVAFFSFCGSIMTVTYIPPFASDKGIPSESIATLITILGGCDLFARFTLAFIADSKFVRHHHIMGFCLGVSGIATMCNPLYSSFKTFLAFAVLYGLFGGVYFSMSILVLRDAVGPKNLPAAYSLMITVHGLASTAVTPLLGFLRDSTGSYNVSLLTMGAGLLLGSIAIFCEPLIQGLEKRRQRILSDEQSSYSSSQVNT